MIAAPARNCRQIAPVSLLALSLLAACSREAPVEETDSAFEETIVVFTTVPTSAVAPLIDAYLAQTGSKIVLIHGSIGDLGARRDEYPDLFIGSNLAELTGAAEQNVLRPTRSGNISRRIPAQLRDPEHLWVSLSTRARTVVYNTRLLNEGELDSVTAYASLADPRWRDRLCLSSSTVPGNASLITRLINDSGLREAERVVRGWRANLARLVLADDTKLLQAIATGECTAGIADSSQLVRFLKADGQTSIAPHWFAGATHIDASGAGVTRHARNPDGAGALLEWLTSREANARFAAALLEFPANPQSSTGAALPGWPAIGAGPVNIANLGYLLEDAAQLAKRARYP